MLDSVASLDDLSGLALTRSKDASGKFQLQFTDMPRKWAAHLSWIILPLSITFWIQCTLVMFFLFRFDLILKSSLLPVCNLVLADKTAVKPGSVLSIKMSSRTATFEDLLFASTMLWPICTNQRLLKYFIPHVMPQVAIPLPSPPNPQRHSQQFVSEWGFWISC